MVRKMKKKKSAPIDGLSQEQLILGANILVTPLGINNMSISDDWREALVTPVHKKGDKTQMENYRPVCQWLQNC